MRPDLLCPNHGKSAKLAIKTTFYKMKNSRIINYRVKLTIKRTEIILKGNNV